MSKHLARDLELLEQEILAQASVVETMIRTACNSLCLRRTDMVWEVLEKEQAVNRREVNIEEECLKILALHQPVATDLRRVATVLKINSDLERIADLAVNISERSRSLAELPELTVLHQLETMSSLAVGMVREALDAFVELDADEARRVCASDDKVDELNEAVIAELNTLMQKRPDLVEPALHFFSAARHVERIADHATNIAEDVIYLVEGEITRHGLGDNDPA
jgi:phosphate transport system protein